MRQCAEREGVFIGVLAFEQQLANKVSAANIMHQVAEIPAAERIVAEVLNDSTTVSVGVCLFDLAVSKSRISLEQQRADLVSPRQIYDLLVGQDRICGRTSAANQDGERNRQRAKRKAAPAWH